MSQSDSSAFKSVTLPDLSNADYKKTTKFSKSAPNYRKVGAGLNLEGTCRNR